ncbi:hypothetical protein [Microbacterium foliorum]|uniref:hypothetical protein n=1 Tax=Microbacterium foliorum TaxID=104336 RepID=UPI0028CFF667|nr:hypothetical protein [Microbacterium foliorum]
MDTLQLERYVEEIDTQARFAAASAKILNDGLSSDSPGATLICFSGAQGILTAGALVSKLLWADTGRDWEPERVAFAVARAEALREIVGVAKDSILKVRAVRNSVEHFDARLDDLLRKHPTANTIDSSVIPKSMMSVDNLVYLRHIDPETMTYSALDDEINLQALFSAIQEAGTAAREWIQKQSRASRA